MTRDSAGRFVPGESGCPGRKKGSRNKAPTQLKEMGLEALEELGGVDYLVTVGREHPKAFMQFIGRILPMQVQGPGDDGEIVITWQK